MVPPDPPGLTFLDDDGNELPADVLETDADDEAANRAHARRARVEQWLPDGSGAAIAALVFVLVAWLGAQPLVQAVTALAPVGSHRIGPLTEQAIALGNSEYTGITPGLIPVITYGTRGLIALLALVLGLRARLRERSPLAVAAVATSSISVALFALGGVLMAIGLAIGNTGGFYYSTPF